MWTGYRRTGGRAVQGAGKDRMKMLAFGSRQAGGSPELVDVLEFLDACQRVYPG